MTDRSFHQVLESARAGDGRAFEQLYESMHRRVYAFAASRGASDPEALVNEVFLKVFTNIQTFVGNKAQFSSWVFKIARNKLIDESRRRKRRVEESQLNDDHRSAAAWANAETEALAHIEDEWVSEQLDLLTAEQRDVVVLRVVSGLTIEEIADVLGKRVGAIKAMQRRAFRTLARNLERQAVPQ
ncbi:MAG TPA: RNA polymerase sigma factor [Ilumatobacter sp.]|nr:RNA polymerase sigma factor [Ilumatobacter sp.]